MDQVQDTHIEVDSADEEENIADSIPITTPLYEGCTLTVPSSSVLIMKFKERHNLTEEGLSDLLQLMKLHCPVPNNCPATVYYFGNSFVISSTL